MKKLLCNSLVASVVAVAGATVFASQANAQSVDLDFNGTVGNTCEITKVSDGKVDEWSGNDKVLHAREDLSAGAEYGEVTVNCNAGGSISLTTPTPVSQSADSVALSNAPGFAPNAVLFLNRNGDPNAQFIAETSGNTEGTITSNGVDVPVYVNMVILSDDPIPAGDYAFRTTVTITPQ